MATPPSFTPFSIPNRFSPSAPPPAMAFGSSPTDAPSGLPINAGGLSQALQTLRGLKGQLTSGQINSADFLQKAQPLVQQATNIEQTIAKQGSKAANTVNPIWQQLQTENFVKNDQGQWLPQLPLTEQEYAQLPASSKPTADQINQGLVPTSALPANVGLQNQIQQQQQQQQTLGQQALGQTQQYQNQATDQLKDIFGKLGNQQLQQAQQNLTTGSQGEQLREYYNSLGLLNSGAFNQGLANQFGQIEQGIENQGLGALAGQVGTNQNQIQDILNSIYGVNSQLGTAGLQRQFSLQDLFTNMGFQRQNALDQQDAYMNALNQQQQNPWTQVGVGAASGLASGLGQALGRKAG